MENSPTKKNSWFGKIETKEECLKVIKDSSYTFFFMAALWIIVSFILPMNVWLDAILFIVLGAILLKFKSRVAAVVLLLLSASDLVVTFINKVNSQSGNTIGGTNVILGFIVLWAAIRAVQATFKFQKIKNVPVPIAN